MYDKEIKNSFSKHPLKFSKKNTERIFKIQLIFEKILILIMENHIFQLIPSLKFYTHRLLIKKDFSAYYLMPKFFKFFQMSYIN
jgi:hypothetical protein